MMDQMKELMALQKKAQAIQDKLGNTHIEAEEGTYTVIVNGKQEIMEIKIDGNNNKELVKVINKALKKSQEIAAHEMKDVMGNLGIPGLGGK